jgi:hypothetical protein
MASTSMWSCTAEKVSRASAGSARSSLSHAEAAAASWGDDELFGFMNAAFAELAGQGLEIERRGHSSKLRKLGHDVRGEFEPLARQGDSLARARGVLPAYNRVDSLGEAGRAAPRPHGARPQRDIQLRDQLEVALTATLEQLNDARVPDRSPEVNRFLDGSRSALWRTLDRLRLIRQHAEGARTP